ncbi:MAG: 16S rRNA (cytidine(1402)-2'-O)-methyltransferase [Candidatus Cloacimonetes bacterium 4572_55]|nr:MAG: 16S rRNA (cytidine(1402)-2'-O)-methyltransferase [Candidatus Cloacimonetes bacterium 4572_55]
MEISIGTLYIVSTPIGNLEDVTLRALRTLEQVDLIVTEDTRHSRKLLKHYEISKRVISYHDHSSAIKLEKVIGYLQEGKSLAYMTDAGTPGVSDPGFLLVRAAIEHDIPVSPIPGPTAAIAGLVGSGLPMNRFVFEGFLPFKSGKRRTRLSALQSETRTMIFYESPHRLLKCLTDMLDIFGNRHICVCRELTKKFEEYIRGSLLDVTRCFESSRPRGEFTLIVRGVTDKKST